MNIMKTRLALIALVSAFSLQPSTLRAQGSLTPPGAPAPTMKSLDQIEARTPIFSAPFTITNPGSYYLTADIRVASGSAIAINTNQVTLDLNGFSISSNEASPAGTGILLAARVSDITICNGHITGGVTNNAGVYSGSGFANGIYYSGSFPMNIRVTGVSVSGCLNAGILLGRGNSTVAESCTVQSTGGNGILASAVSHSTAYQCGAYGIVADTASGCYASSTGFDDGLQADTANNCYGYATGSGHGLYVNKTAINCYGQNYGSGDGLYATVAIGCYGYSSSGTGLGAYIANSCYSNTGDGGIQYKYNMP